MNNSILCINHSDSCLTGYFLLKHLLKWTLKCSLHLKRPLRWSRVDLFARPQAKRLGANLRDPLQMNLRLQTWGFFLLNIWTRSADCTTLASHWSHLQGLSPVWVRRGVCKCSMILFSRTLQRWGRSPVCLCTCTISICRLAAPLSPSYNFWWLLRRYLSLSLLLKLSLHFEPVKLSTEWVCLCLCTDDFEAKALPHSEQEYGFSPVCTVKCLSRILFLQHLTLTWLESCMYIHVFTGSTAVVQRPCPTLYMHKAFHLCGDAMCLCRLVRFAKISPHSWQFPPVAKDFYEFQVALKSEKYHCTVRQLSTVASFGDCCLVDACLATSYRSSRWYSTCCCRGPGSEKDMVQYIQGWNSAEVERERGRMYKSLDSSVSTFT